MVVVGTKPENFYGVWVKNEWSRYIALIKTGEKKVLIPAYRDMDAYDLPDEFSHLQALDMNKLGFMQDLIRGIKKIMGLDGHKTVAKERVLAISHSGIEGNVDALMKRAFIFLEDGDFSQAEEYFNRVLDADPENPRAYIGLLCIQLNLKQEESLRDCTPEITNNQNFDKALRFASEDYRNTLIEYTKDMQLNLAIEKTKNISSYGQAAQILTQLEGYKNADDILRLMEDNVKSITQIALDSDDIQLKFDTIDQLHSVGSFGEAEQYALQLTEHVNTLFEQTAEGAKKLQEINTYHSILQAKQMISPFSQRIKSATELVYKLTSAEETLTKEKNKAEKKKARKRKGCILLGLFLLMFILGWITTKGFVNRRYSYVKVLANGLTVVAKDRSGSNSNKGIVNKYGFQVVPRVYREISEFYDGLALVKKDGKYGFINTSGKEVVPVIYDNVDGFINGLARVEKGGNIGYVNATGDEVVPTIYDFVYDFIDGFAQVRKDFKYGYVNAKGDEVVPAIYDFVYDFIDGLARVEKDGKYGCVNATGDEVVPCIYDELDSWFTDGLAFAIRGGKHVLVNRFGEEFDREN